MIGKKQWPCYFFKSDTTGEKDFEEFYSENDYLDLTRFKDLGIIQNEADFNENKLDDFTNGITNLANSGIWDKNAILELYHILLPDFNHKETGKYLDQRM